MKPLQVLVRDVAAPVLRARGYKRSAGTFRHATAEGVAVIQISGLGGIGITDLDFHVCIGFTTSADLLAKADLPNITPARLIVALGASTWQTRLWDPAIEGSSGHVWRFNEDNVTAKDTFAAVLDMAAVDVVKRLLLWPDVPQDSLSRPPQYWKSLDVGERPEYSAVLDLWSQSLRQPLTGE